MRGGEVLSTRDKIFGVLAEFSALYCFAVSLALSLLRSQGTIYGWISSLRRFVFAS
jgi:hypothetical protein